jgi:hypothetical protein
VDDYALESTRYWVCSTVIMLVHRDGIMHAHAVKIWRPAKCGFLPELMQERANDIVSIEPQMPLPSLPLLPLQIYPRFATNTLLQL